jgi:DNA adenine methylase
VAIERRDAAEVINRLDAPSALFYVDPPYPTHTRTASVGKHGYRHELTDDQHRALGRTLHAADGMVVLSGYACPLYDRELYSDWERHEKKALADGARQRTEVVWLNRACSVALATARRQGVFPYERKEVRSHGKEAHQETETETGARAGVLSKEGAPAGALVA